MDSAQANFSGRPLAPFPLSLAIVAVLSILWGLYDAASMLADIRRGQLTINLGVLLVPLGLGVLVRSNGCRVVLAALSLLVLVLAPLLLCMIVPMAATVGGDFYVTLLGRRIKDPDAGQIGLSLAITALWWLLELWCYRVLRSERARAACGQPPRVVI